MTHVHIDSRRSLDELVEAVCEGCNLVVGDDHPLLVLHVAGGADFDRAGTGVDIATVSRWEHALRRAEWVNAPVIAVAEGRCGGPAVEALLVADFRIVTLDFQLVVPSSAGLAWPGMAVHRLANQLGVSRARRLLFTLTEMSASRALGLELVDEVTDDPAAATRRATASLGRVPGIELAIRRRLLLEASTASFEDALGVHLAACDRVLRQRALVGGDGHDL